MKLGFLTACLPLVGLNGLLRWASKRGFQTIELAAWPVKSERDYQARQIDVAHFSKSEAHRIQDLLSKHNMEISAMAYYDNNLDPDRSKRKYYHDHLKRVINAAALLEVKLVGTFVGARPDRLPGENMKEIGRVFRGIVRYAEDRGISIMIENCPMDSWQRFGCRGILHILRNSGTPCSTRCPRRTSV